MKEHNYTDYSKLEQYYETTYVMFEVENETDKRLHILQVQAALEKQQRWSVFLPSWSTDMDMYG